MKAYLRFCSVLAMSVAALLLGAPPAQARKPSDPGGGGSTPLTNPAFVYYDSAGSGLFLINSSGTSKSRLTSNAGTEDLAPTWSPDLNPSTPGHQGSIAFFRQHSSSPVWGDIMAIPSDGSAPATVLRSFADFSVPFPELDNGETSMSWSPDGSRIVYASEGSIWALDVATSQVDRIFGIGFHPTYAGSFHPSLSPDQEPVQPGYQGQLAFTLYGNGPVGGNGADIGLAGISIDPSGNLTMDGTWTLLTNSTGWVESRPSWSPDGRYLAMNVRPAIEEPFGSGRAIDVWDTATGASWEVASVFSFDVRPTWSSDSLSVGFGDARQLANGKWTTDILYVDAGILGPPVNVTSSRAFEKRPAWNPAWVNDLSTVSVAAVPEPGTIALGAIGFGALALRASRRRGRRVMCCAAALCCTLSAHSALAAGYSFTPLGDLPGGAFASAAEKVSADGSVVVGSSSTALGREAFRWTAGGGMVGLGDLPVGAIRSFAGGVSADGSVIVGSGETAAGACPIHQAARFQPRQRWPFSRSRPCGSCWRERFWDRFARWGARRGHDLVGGQRHAHVYQPPRLHGGQRWGLAVERRCPDGPDALWHGLAGRRQRGWDALVVGRRHPYVYEPPQLPLDERRVLNAAYFGPNFVIHDFETILGA